MSKSTPARGYGNGAAFELFSYPRRSLWVRVPDFLWRWRVELILGVVVAYGWWRLNRVVASPVAWLVLVAVAGLLFGPPVIRRYIVRHLWCTVSRHRLRSCFVANRVMNRKGQLPRFLWVRPTEVGERVSLLMPPGTSVRDIEDRADEFSASCWAREVRVSRHRANAARVVITVVRRDPLTAKNTVTSPLTNLGDGLDVPSAPQAEASVEPAAPATPTTSPTVKPAIKPRPSAPAVLAGNGEDLSDYV